MLRQFLQRKNILCEFIVKNTILLWTKNHFQHWNDLFLWQPENYLGWATSMPLPSTHHVFMEINPWKFVRNMKKSHFTNPPIFNLKIQNIFFLFPPHKNQAHIVPTYLQPHYGNGVFCNVYLLALDNTKR